MILAKIGKASFLRLVRPGEQVVYLRIVNVSEQGRGHRRNYHQPHTGQRRLSTAAHGNRGNDVLAHRQQSVRHEVSRV